MTATEKLENRTSESRRIACGLVLLLGIVIIGLLLGGKLCEGYRCNIFQTVYNYKLWSYAQTVLFSVFLLTVSAFIQNKVWSSILSIAGFIAGNLYLVLFVVLANIGSPESIRADHYIEIIMRGLTDFGQNWGKDILPFYTIK